MRRGRQGGALIEAAMFFPFIALLLFGMMSFGRIAFTYYTLHKLLYQIARSVTTLQTVDFCNDSNGAIANAKNLAVTGTTDGSGNPFLPNLTADQITVRIERLNDLATSDVSECGCDITGCDTLQGASPPDFVTVYLPEGYPVTPVIPFFASQPIPLRPQIRVPYGGT